MINDTQSLVGARQSQAWDEYGSPIAIYDDGLGPLWLYREAGGLQGIVRAMSWEAAYECCQDEIMSRVPQDEVIEAYGFYVMEHSGLFWACPDIETEHAYYQSFEDIPDRLALSSFFSKQEAIQCCLDTIEREECELIEGYEYQPNATGTGIVSFDLNGSYLELLTPELAERLGIRIQIEESDV